MAISAGETLSLNNLAGASGDTQNSNVSLGDIKGSPSAGDNISLSSFGIDSVGSISGFTYAVESTNETYTLGFGGEGSNFGTLKGRYQNLSWSVTPSFNSSADSSGFLSIGSNSDYTAVITVGSMNPQGASSQVSLSNAVSHTLSATYNDGYNDHATNYNSARTKTVHSIDSYDGNTTGLCLTADTPVTLGNGTTIEIGEVEEGMKLQGYSLNELSNFGDSEFMNWNTSELNQSEKQVEVVNVIFSFASKYYDINDGDVKCTSEHPFLILENSEYRFKRAHLLNEGDILIKGNGSNVEEVSISSINIIEGDVEIVSLDVSDTDTYMANGYITHNKGTNSHTDFDGPDAPTSVAYSHPNLSWSGGTADTDSGGVTGYDVQVDNNSDFSSPVINETNWNASSIQLAGGDIAAGTYYARVRNVQSGLKSAYTTVGGSNSSFTVTV
tara:strand:- start:3015 stop:4340 length:1326 start_codon:yes stop_codon:yes gene_type:complete